TIRMWDANTGEAVGWPLQGHQDSGLTVAFSSDGKQIASTSQDYTMFSELQCSCLSHDAHETSCFTHQCFINTDGWLCLPKSPDLKSQPDRLLFWIPHESCQGLWWPGNTAVICQYPLQLDLSNFHHGEDWTTCYIKND
ncbi:hypothetical protein M422DRAFT_176759, partial [Sphaerobolus stellatus SS14]